MAATTLLRYQLFPLTPRKFMENLLQNQQQSNELPKHVLQESLVHVPETSSSQLRYLLFPLSVRKFMVNHLQESQQARDLPNDVLQEILVRVPASSLLTCQVVCKNWLAKIQEPQFKNDHFDRKIMTNEPLRLLVVKLGGVTSVIFCENPEGVFDLDQCRKIWMPEHLGSTGKFRGSCKGLLCTEVRGKITVFNPFTRQCVSLPRPTDLFLGFGLGINEKMHTDLFFHSATGEYKVVLWYCDPTTMDSYTINVYTLGCPNRSWRKVIDSVVTEPSNSGVNVVDTIYWPFLTEDYDTVISFDLSTEKFDNHRTVIHDELLLSIDVHEDWSSIPHAGWEEGKLVGVTKWDGRLCAITFHWHPVVPKIKLWTLELINIGERVWHLEKQIQLGGLMINAAVRLPAPYSIKKNMLNIYLTSKAICFHDLSENPDDVIRVMWPPNCEISNCFDYVESLFRVPI